MTRPIILLLALPLLAHSQLAWKDVGGRFELTDHGKPALVYNHAPQYKEGAPEDRRRCCYIFPVYTPAGVSMLDDFPKDHWHHRGVFWSWPVVETGGKKYDNWMTMTARHRSSKPPVTTANAREASLRAENFWTADGKDIVRENLHLTVFPALPDSREFEVELTWEAVSAPVTLRGSREQGKSYGGFSARFAPREGTILRADGEVLKKDEDLTPHRWAELEGVYGGKKATLRITPDPQNPAAPYQWCLRNYGFVGASFPGRTDTVDGYTLEKGKPLTLKFRVKVSHGPELSAEQRAADLVARMTLEEKVLQMQNTAPALPRLGIPAYDWWNEALHGVARAGQATVFPQAIGLAATWDTDLMHRIADTISTEARAKYNEAIRNNDHSRYHGLTFWSPNINIFRDPRWGRGQETYGEDPYLTGRMAVAFIKGMQGDDPHYFKVIATAKHYAVHSGPEPSRHQFDVHPSQRDLDETYLPAFRASIVEGKADSVMCAYNRVDGVPACASTDLLQKRLRGEWGFQGYIVSDCGAIADIYRGHKYKPTAAEASAVAVKAGTDLTCGTEYRSLVDAVKAGQITEAEINRSIERLFVARFKLGMFDPPDRVPFNQIPYSENDSPAHRQIALEAARKSIVLLKNENQTLPLKAAVRKIAVIGPSADDPDALLGNYNGFSSKHVTPLEGIEHQWAGKAEVRFALGANYTTQSPALLPATGVQAEYFANADLQGAPVLSRREPRPYLSGLPDPAVPARPYSVRWTGSLKPPVTGDYTFMLRGPVKVFLDDNETARGQLDSSHTYRLRVEYRAPERGPAGMQIGWIPPAAPLLAEAVDAVKTADVALVFVGLNPSLEGEEMRVSVPGFLGGDRTNIEIPEPQEKLIEAVIATGKPVVVVLTSGSALGANFAAAHAAAVLEAWYAGEEAGTAIAETLAGVNNPAGRLPVTFYRSLDQLPPFDDYAMKGRTYRYFKGDPLYGFGFGLSYSKFRYSGLKTQRTAAGGRVSVKVKNESTREGDEVVQLYLDGAGGSDDPIRQLRAFQRIHLRAGETRDVEFSLAGDALPKTKVRITVGGGQPAPQVAHVEGVL